MTTARRDLLTPAGAASDLAQAQKHEDEHEHGHDHQAVPSDPGKHPKVTAR